MACGLNLAKVRHCVFNVRDVSTKTKGEKKGGLRCVFYLAVPTVVQCGQGPRGVAGKIYELPRACRLSNRDDIGQYV